MSNTTDQQPTTTLPSAAQPNVNQPSLTLPNLTSPVSEPKSEQQMHYESLISFLKWGVGIAGGLITIISIVAAVMFFKDRKELQDNYMRELERYSKGNIELKEDAKNRQSELKDSYDRVVARFDKNIDDMKRDAKEQQDNLSNRYDKQIEDLRTSSRDQLLSIVSATRSAVTEQTQKEISDLFKTDRIQKMIEKNAVGELNDKLPSMVAEYATSLPRILEGAQWMQGGSAEGMDRLKSYFSSESKFERDLSRRLYDDGVRSINSEISKFSIEQLTVRLREMGVKLNTLHKIENNHFPIDKADIENLTLLMNALNDSTFENQNMLFGVGFVVKVISYISNKDFSLFNKEEINLWYRALKR